MPSVRTASCAPATVFSRLIATGRITPGNSTMLRTGRMISMSSGRLGAADVVAVAWPLTEALLCVVLRRHVLSFACALGSQRRASSSCRQPFTALRGDQFPLAVAERETALEAAIGNLESLDRESVRATRQRPFTADHDFARSEHAAPCARAARRAVRPRPAPGRRSCRRPPAAPTGAARGCPAVARRKNCRCRRSACSSRSTVSAHIHVRGSRRLIARAAWN